MYKKLILFFVILYKIESTAISPRETTNICIMEETKKTIVMFGWYSSEQHKIHQSELDMKHPYIYYVNMKDEIVQVTEIKYSESDIGSWDDSFCLGQMKRFYKSTETPIIHLSKVDTSNDSPQKKISCK